MKYGAIWMLILMAFVGFAAAGDVSDEVVVQRQKARTGSFTKKHSVRILQELVPFHFA